MSPGARHPPYIKKPFKGKNYTRIFHISFSHKYQVLNYYKTEVIKFIAILCIAF